jgi:hypothetical protein
MAVARQWLYKHVSTATISVTRHGVWICNLNVLDSYNGAGIAQ